MSGGSGLDGVVIVAGSSGHSLIGLGGGSMFRPLFSSRQQAIVGSALTSGTFGGAFGGGGAGGAAANSASVPAGGDGFSGVIIVNEFYQ